MASNTTSTDEPWYKTFDDTFWLTISGTIFAFLTVVLRACLKSRCTQIKCLCYECIREPLVDASTEDIKLEPNAPVSEPVEEDPELGHIKSRPIVK